MRNKEWAAILCALLAAAFYALNAPMSKLLLVGVQPTMMAAMLYLGAGLGVGLLSLARRDRGRTRERLGQGDLPYVLGMIVLDIAAPILLMVGLSGTTAANAALLNNFEIVATTVIALCLFREHVSPRFWGAVALIAAASALLTFEGRASFQFSRGSLLILLAACCWGLENNCTRMISSKDTYEIVTLKGVFSGLGSLVIALLTGESLPPVGLLLPALLLGFVAYGLSIFFYIRAQSVIGAAKTSAYYALAPFIGVLFSFLILREPFSATYGAALLVMAVGSAVSVWDTLAHGHSHSHSHRMLRIHQGRLVMERVTHTHEHEHIGRGIFHGHIHCGKGE